jgi:hypothetical protein
VTVTVSSDGVVGSDTSFFRVKKSSFPAKKIENFVKLSAGM